MSTSIRTLVHLTLAMAAIAPAVAAEAPASTLPDIVVTAEKRSENLQEVPLSVAAISESQIAETGVQDFASLAARIPSVTLNSAGPGRSSYSIRGIASIGGNAPTTGFYVDDTPLLPSGGDGANAGIDPDLFDLARIEVLRGPQGTLYGASSMGGTIKLVTNAPDPHKVASAIKAEGSFTDHGSGNGRIDGMLNLPLAGGRAALRLVATAKHESGFIDREIGVWAPNPNADPTLPPYPVSPATPTSVIHQVNTEDRTSARAVLRIEANDHLVITPSVWVQQLSMGAPSDFDIASGTTSDALVTRRPFNVSEHYTDHFVLSNLTVSYDLGFGTLLSTTAYLQRQETTPDDQSEALEIAIPQGLFLPSVYAPTVTTRELTEELRLSFGDAHSALSGVVGAYFNNANRHYFVDYVVPGYDSHFRNSPTSILFFGPGPLDDTNYWQQGNYSPKQYAVFSELNYALSEHWRLTAGLRWYDLEYTTVRHEDGLSNGGPSLSVGTAKNNGINPKAEIAYTPHTGLLYYASVARGVRPGGVNTSNLAQKGCGQDYGPYDPDSLWNYEVGAKTRLFDDRVTANGAVYYVRWDNVQQGKTLPCSYQITENAGKATVRGAELELNVLASEHLALGAGMGYTEAVLAVDAPELDGHKGQQLENVPKWNGSANAKYTFPAFSGYDGFVRADATFVGTSYPDFDRTDPATFQRSYTLVDLRAGIVREGLEWNVFVDNVTGKQAALSKFITDNYDASTRTRMFTNRPRTIGLSISYRY